MPHACGDVQFDLIDHPYIQRLETTEGFMPSCTSLLVGMLRGEKYNSEFRNKRMAKPKVGSVPVNGASPI